MGECIMHSLQVWNGRQTPNFTCISLLRALKHLFKALGVFWFWCCWTETPAAWMIWILYLGDCLDLLTAHHHFFPSKSFFICVHNCVFECAFYFGESCVHYCLIAWRKSWIWKQRFSPLMLVETSNLYLHCLCFVCAQQIVNSINLSLFTIFKYLDFLESFFSQQEMEKYCTSAALTLSLLWTSGP